MNILLIRPKYPNYFDGYSPTNLAILGAIAVDLGHTVKIADLNVDHFPENERFDIIGITGMSMWKKEIIDLTESFLGGTIIVGGSWANLYPEEVLSNKKVDYICVGEGEKVWKEFLENYPQVKNIEGIGYKTNQGKIIINPQTTRITDLSLYPLPNWSLIQNIRKYKNVSVYGSRGCPFDCIFCSNKTTWGHQWRARSAESVIDEIELLVKKHKVKSINFNDENMTLDPKRFEAICQGIIDKKLKVTLNVLQGVRVDKLPFRLLDLMKKAGFKALAFSPESGCQRVLKEVIRKNLDLSTVEPVVKHCVEIGLHPMARFVIGFPWETKEEITETLQYADHLRKLGAEAFVGNAIPFRDTDLYRKAKAEGFIQITDAAIEKATLYRDKPRAIHCLTSPYWTPDWIIDICKSEGKKDMAMAMKRTPKTRLIKKTIRHPVMMLKKLGRAI